MQNLFSDARSFLQKLWTFEVFTAEDTITVDGQKITGKRSVTIGKIVMAVLILVVGYWITGLVSRVVEPIIVKRLKIEPNQANLIRRWLRAFLVVCLVMFSLVSVKIPLTVFAFAGGALAIGLGFGMQTMLKNFVSGIIILFERPFRVGDVLDVGGQRGTVTSIGLRASVLQLWDGTETLIPNSTLAGKQPDQLDLFQPQGALCRHRGRGLRLGPAAGHPSAERSGRAARVGGERTQAAGAVHRVRRQHAHFRAARSGWMSPGPMPPRSPATCA